MQETKSLTYPSGSKLVRLGRKQKEVWIYENNALANTRLFIDISHRGQGDDVPTVIMDGDNDLSEKWINGEFQTYLFKINKLYILHFYTEIKPFEKKEIAKIVKSKNNPFEPIFRIEETPISIDDQEGIMEEQIQKVIFLNIY